MHFLHIFFQKLINKKRKNFANISCFKFIESLDFLCFGSSDSNIRVYDNSHSYLGESPQILKGHIKGLRSIDYHERQGILASCSFEFVILLWNLYLNEPIVKLEGIQNNMILS